MNEEEWDKKLESGDLNTWAHELTSKFKAFMVRVLGQLDVLDMNYLQNLKKWADDGIEHLEKTIADDQMERSLEFAYTGNAPEMIDRFYPKEGVKAETTEKEKTEELTEDLPEKDQLILDDIGNGNYAKKRTRGYKDQGLNNNQVSVILKSLVKKGKIIKTGEGLKAEYRIV